MNVIDYKVISENCADDLIETVNRYLAAGWRVYGNPAIDATGYLQAVIKKKQ